MKLKQTSYFAALAAGALLAAVSSVQAVPSLTVTDGAANTSGVITSPGGGVVTFSGAVGKWNINVDTGQTKPIIGSASNPSMDLNFADTFTDTAGTATAGQKVLTLVFSDTDFTGITGFLKTIGGTLGSGISLTYQAFYSTANTLFTQTTAIGSLLSFTSTPYSGSNSGAGPSSQPYSLTQVITLTYAGGATSGGVASSGDATLASVPEGGATSALLGIAVLMLGFIRRKMA
jgi:hypothetical protein